EISKGVPKGFRLLDRRIESNGKVIFAFNKSLEDPNIIVLHPPQLNETKRVEYTLNQDTASMWLADLTFDSLKVQFNNADTLLDSITMRRGRNDKYDRDFIITDNLTGNRVTRVRHIELTAGAPVESIDRSKIILLEDSIPRTNFQLAKDTLA